MLRPAALAASLLFAWAAAAAPLSGLDRAGMDPQARAQDDLYDAMNGRWQATTPIPADKSGWGTTLRLRDESDAHVQALVEDLARQPAEKLDASRRQLADYFRAYADTAAIDAAGLKPIAPALARIDALRTASDIAAYLGASQGEADGPLDVTIDPDPKRPDVYVAGLSQSGLGLPDRDYLLVDDARFQAARQAYRGYVERLLALSGDERAAAHADDVLAFETRLARAQWSRVENRDPVKTYHPTSRDALAPGIDWTAFLAAARVGGATTVMVSQPPYVAAVAQAMKDVPVETWRAYLRVRRLDASAAVLPAPFREARHAFRDVALAGVQQEPPRARLAVAAVNGALGEAVGRLYVEQHFPPEAKARMQALVANLMKSYATSIDQLSWMSAATKQAARVKLSKYTLKIGYPDVWRDYSSMVVRGDDALGNLDRARRFAYERRAVRLGHAVDRGEWHMTPQTVNAYYSAEANEIVFPAAILQPPFFDLAADDAVNYGAIGAVIGHEISHGFDDEGSRYDGDGALRDWWSDADRAAFDKLAEKLAAQYDAYEPIKGHHVNGHLTLGENIADLSGLQISFKAYELSLGGKPSPVIDGYTGEQRFFLGYAQSRRSKLREARELELLTRDPHSPGRYRTDGAAVNHDGFHQAFGTKPGDAMWKAPEERIRIW